ncbi:MAG TPA: hypothetical protein VLE71_06080 [Actinomycetota bacterium]|nr:hypothetical protein [Actinomycetota bacterium]
MRRPALLALVLLSLAAAACSGGDEPPASPSPTRTPSPSPSPSTEPTEPAPPSPAPSPSPSPIPWTVPESVRVPADAPTTLDDPAAIDAVESGDLAPLAPPASEVARSATLIGTDERPAQLAVAWRRGDDPFSSEQGVVVWQRFRDDPRWRAVYAFTDRPRAGVLGIRLDADDLTGDGTLDALTFEQQGGSGACGIWRVVVSTPGAADEVFRRSTCDTEIRVAKGGLSVREAVFEPEDPHCCPSHLRTSRLEWDGEAFVEVSSELVDVR